MATVTIPKKLTKEVRIFIIQAIYEILNDPDFGLELNEKVQKRLRQVLATKQKPII